MKVGQQSVHDLKTEWRMDENARFSCVFYKFSTILRCDTFQHAHGGRAHGNDAPSGGLRFVHRTRGFFIQGKTFLVHSMRGQHVGRDRQKCSGANVQRDETNLHALGRGFVAAIPA